MGRPALLASFLVAIAMITWQNVRLTGQVTSPLTGRIPPPQRFVNAGIVWAVLGIVSELGADSLAAVFGWGLVLVLAYEYYNSKPTGSVTGTGAGGLIGPAATGSSAGTAEGGRTVI